MDHLRKLKLQSFLKFNLTEKNCTPSKSSLRVTGYCYIAQNPRLYRTKAAVKSNNGEKVDEEDGSKFSLQRRRQAQTALLDYLHSTRSLQYMDAEHISRNSPRFLVKLLEEVENEMNFERSLARFLHYHPINEFEPFFESMGLRPSEYSSYLPRDLMFLSDNKMLLENYHVLCACGIDRSKMGKIFKEANEVFRYDLGVLDLKMRLFQEVGLNKVSVIKLVTLCPHILTVYNGDFFQVLERLKRLGIVPEWIVGKLSEGKSYNWHCMLEILFLLSKLGCSDEQLEGLLRKHPEILLEDSGSTAIPLIGFMLKFGASASDITSMFLNLPEIPFQKFVSNLWRCHLLFAEIEMAVQDIAKLVCAYPVLLGSCSLKKASSLLNCLNTGKKRLREIIKENPQEIKNWVMGSRVKRLPPSTGVCMLEKTKFLSYLGFVENSTQMKKALRTFRGKGGELQERFDCLVNAGLNEKDVKEMLMIAPEIINQTKELLEKKINCLLSLGYPISSLIAYPSLLANTIQRVKLRVSMYNWLKDQGTESENLALSTIIASSDRLFIAHKVNRHPNGPEVWEKLKKQIYSE